MSFYSYVFNSFYKMSMFLLKHKSYSFGLHSKRQHQTHSTYSSPSSQSSFPRSWYLWSSSLLQPMNFSESVMSEAIAKEKQLLNFFKIVKNVLRRTVWKFCFVSCIIFNLLYSFRLVYLKLKLLSIDSDTVSYSKSFVSYVCS